MKNCEQFLPDLCAWLDGELKDSRALEAHLAECASCRALAEQYRQLDTELAAVAPPPELHERIMQAVTMQTMATTHKAKRRFAFGSATAVAAVAAVLVLAIGSGWIQLPAWKNAESAAPAAFDTAASVENEKTQAAPPAEFQAMESEIVYAADSVMDAPAAEPAAPPANDMVGADDSLEDTVAEITTDSEAFEEPAEEPLHTGTTSAPAADAVASSADLKLYEEEKKETLDTTVQYVEQPSDGLLTGATDNVDGLTATNGREVRTWHIYGYTPETLPGSLTDQVVFEPMADGSYCADVDPEVFALYYNSLYEELGGDLYGVAYEESDGSKYDQIWLMPDHIMPAAELPVDQTFWVIVGQTPDTLPEPFNKFSFTKNNTGSALIWYSESMSQTLFDDLYGDYAETLGATMISGTGDGYCIVLIPSEDCGGQMIWTIRCDAPELLPEPMQGALTFEQRQDGSWTAAAAPSTVYMFFTIYGETFGGNLALYSTGQSSYSQIHLVP